jgi:murein DD-endopeptidase MepM/ murein hydrolase activator NlpD
MVRDDRLYAFIVARTSRSRSRIRRISIHKRWVKLLTYLCMALMCASLYGFYGLTQHVFHLRVEQENDLLRAENLKQREQLSSLSQRVEAVEDASRRLVEMSGVSSELQGTPRGAGGPALPLESASTPNAIRYKTDYLEQALRAYESLLRERSTVPSLMPVSGTMESGFGGRRNPFGGSSFEFHTGQDIEALMGEPVIAAASGTVIYAGWMNGYGQLVVIDHGAGLTSRYGHLSKIDASVGQSILRGQLLGHVGSTGRSTGPHLHYEVRINDKPVDPRPYLPSGKG